MNDRHAHHRLVQEKFTEQAERWGKMDVDPELAELLDRIELREDACVLDVAAGTGLLARALAPRVKEVIAVDITPAMLERGREAAKRQGIANVAFIEGAAERLPFPDGTFDLAVTRFSLHHIAEPQAVVNEMVRVVRGRGRVAVIDLLGPDDPATADRFNALQRRRDASHARTLSWSDLRATLDRAGAKPLDTFTRDRMRRFDDWVEVSGAEVKDELRAALEAELSGSETTGFQPFLENGELFFHHPIGMIVARA